MQEFDLHWRELSEEGLIGRKEWRGQHLKATLREIEAALDERLGQLRVSVQIVTHDRSSNRASAT